jgi:hypothetical protein
MSVKYNTAFSLLMIVLFSAVSCTQNKSKEKNQNINPQQCDFTGLETGDIVLKRGFGKISNLITQYFNEKVPISHCGIIVVNNDSTFIVHSVAKSYARKDGVQTILFRDFLKDCQKDYFYIVRQKAPAADRQKFASKAIEFTQMNITFDENANNESKEQMSCTELIYWCQKETFGKSDLTTMSIAGKDLFVFNGLLDSSKFEIIKHY